MAAKLSLMFEVFQYRQLAIRHVQGVDAFGDGPACRMMKPLQYYSAAFAPLDFTEGAADTL